MSSDRGGSLYLLPNTLGEVAPEAVIPAGVLDRARSLDYIVAEDPKAARAFLKRIAPTRREQNIRVVPLSGPSSIVLALAASGLDGQRFAFRGYLPVAETELVSTLKECERQSRKLGQTQIFIETPYRNDRTLATMLRALGPATLVCVAADLTLESETVKTRPVVIWRKEPLKLKGRPTVFLLLAI